jgi:hypothetical protein
MSKSDDYTQVKTQTVGGRVQRKTMLAAIRTATQLRLNPTSGFDAMRKCLEIFLHQTQPTLMKKDTLTSAELAELKAFLQGGGQVAVDPEQVQAALKHLNLED